MDIPRANITKFSTFVLLNFSKTLLSRKRQHISVEATCRSPAGLSGLCNHILALLLVLKDFTEVKHKILGLTCIEQLKKVASKIKKGYDTNGSTQ